MRIRLGHVADLLSCIALGAISLLAVVVASTFTGYSAGTGVVEAAAQSQETENARSLIRKPQKLIQDFDAMFERRYIRFVYRSLITRRNG